MRVATVKFPTWLLPILLAGCEGNQSALSPHGFGAREIAELSWILFGLGAAVLALVLVAVALAIRGSPTTRSRLAGRRTVILGGIALPAFTLTGLLGYAVWLTDARSAQPDRGKDVAIDIVGEQWWWRVAYASAEGSRIGSANEVRIPVGTDVEFTLRSADV